MFMWYLAFRSGKDDTDLKPGICSKNKKPHIENDFGEAGIDAGLLKEMQLGGLPV